VAKAAVKTGVVVCRLFLSLPAQCFTFSFTVIEYPHSCDHVRDVGMRDVGRRLVATS